MSKEKGISINVLKTRRNAAIRRLADSKPFIEGSLTKIRVKCGNPNCCCAQGEKHISHVLTKKVCGKTKSLYVPVDLVEEVTKWVEEHRRIKRELKEISSLSEQIIRQHVSTRQAVNKNLERLNRLKRTS